MKAVKILLSFIIFITFLLLLYTVFCPHIIVENNTIYLGSSDEVQVGACNLFKNLDSYLTSDGKVDRMVPGKYTVNYKIKYLFYSIKKKVTIYVKDNISPSIVLNGDNPSLVCPNKEYIEEGYIVSDNYDNESAIKVERNELGDRIQYIAKDSSNNISIYERKLEFKDEEKPSISLVGSANMTIYVGNNYIEPGYVSFDNCDGDITDKVVSTGYVDTLKIGTYTISYEVTDSSGNQAVISRNITVKKKPNYMGNGIIYLTFDDGPSALTEQILDILDEENIKATFFVCNANELTKRAYDSGHTIALHSYTHDYSYVYSSSSNYFEDLSRISDKVYNNIGIRSNIIRFPGGSSNMVSKHYHLGIMSYLTNEVVNRGYNYFDWNVDSNDAGSDLYRSDNIYYNVINNLSHNKTNIVLMHDSNGHSATVKALKNIIRYGKDNGYSFARITDNTPSVRHSVNN